MATSGSWTGSRTVSYGPQLKLSWRRTAVDIPNNRSKVKLTLQLYAGYRVDFSSPKSGRLHGSGFTYTGGFRGTGTKTIKTKEFWVNHNSDGTKSFSVSAWLDVNISMSAGYVSRISVGGTVNLDTIPRESKLNSFRVYNSLKPDSSCRLDLDITRYSSSFTHIIEVRYGSTAIATWSGQGTPTTLHLSSSQVKALLNKMANSTTGTLTMIISTHNGSTRIGGYSSRSATATVNTGVKPSISGFSTSISGNGRDKSIGKYVQNITRVSASFSASATGGAYLVSNRVYVRKDSNHANAMTIHGSSGASGTLTSSGLYEAIAESIDSRGRTTTRRATFTVEAYSKPKITVFSAKRDATTDTTVNITRNGTFTTLGTSNPTDIVLSKRVPGGSWATITGGLSQHTSGSFGANKTNTGNSATSSYEFRLTVTDSFNNTAEATQMVSTARTTLDIHKNEGVGIGKIHEKGVLDVDGDVYMRGGVYLTGLPTSGQDFQLVIDPEAGQSAIEVGSTSHNGLSFVDFHTRAGDNDYDARILAREGVTGDHGRGILEFTAERLIYRDKVDGDFYARDIVGSGSNSNGAWTQFYDGTQITVRRLSLSRDVNATSTDLPKPFVGEYGVTLSLNNNDQWAMENLGMFTAGKLDDSRVSLRRFGTPNTGLTWSTQLIITVIGRWK